MVLTIKIKAANPIKTANDVAAIIKVSVSPNNLSIASPEALISLTAEFPSVLSIINL